MRKNKPVKARQIKARIRWQNMPNRFPIKIAVIDITDPKTSEDLVDQLIDAISSVHQPMAEEDYAGPSWEESQARAVLTSLGLLRPATRNRKRKGKM